MAAVCRAQGWAERTCGIIPAGHVCAVLQRRVSSHDSFLYKRLVFRHQKTMKLDYALFLRALGLAIVIEGLCWTLFPGGMRRALLQLLPQPESRLRVLGLIALAVGLGLVALASH